MQNEYVFCVRCASSEGDVKEVERRLAYTIKGHDVVAMLLKDVSVIDNKIYCTEEQFYKWHRHLLAVIKSIERVDRLKFRRPVSEVKAIVLQATERHPNNLPLFLKTLNAKLFNE